VPGRLFSPIWIHSDEPPGPWPGPPTPTQPATCPLSTTGVASALIVAETPWPVCVGWTPAYAYPDGPHAPDALAETAVTVQQAAASAAASAIAKRKGRTTSWSKRTSLHRPDARAIGPPRAALHPSNTVTRTSDNRPVGEVGSSSPQCGLV
jgi:hypothetical protein